MRITCGCMTLVVRICTFALFVFVAPATTEIYTLSLHDALPICVLVGHVDAVGSVSFSPDRARIASADAAGMVRLWDTARDRKSTRLNSSHSQISYAVFCLKKKKLATGWSFRVFHADEDHVWLYDPCGAYLHIRVICFRRAGDHRDLHSFPTRRSSDLCPRRARRRRRERLVLPGSRADRLRGRGRDGAAVGHRERSEEHTSELQSQSNLVCRLLLEKKKTRDWLVVSGVSRR